MSRPSRVGGGSCETGACCRVQRNGGGKDRTKIPGEQEAPPYPKLEATKEKGTVVPFGVLLTQGFTPLSS